MIVSIVLQNKSKTEGNQIENTQYIFRYILGKIFNYNTCCMASYKIGRNVVDNIFLYDLINCFIDFSE